MSENRSGFRAHPRGNRGAYTNPRGGYRGVSSAFRGPTKECSPEPPFGDIIATIDPSALPLSDKLPNITGSEYVASYNWLDRSTPTILIPGKISPSQLSSKVADLSKVHHQSGLPPSIDNAFRKTVETTSEIQTLHDTPNIQQSRQSER